MDCTGDLCVCPRTTRPITAWKLEDTVIQELANDEGLLVFPFVYCHTHIGLGAASC